MDADLLKKVKPLLNSVLVTVKDTLTIDQMRRDYMNIVGKEIPYRELGYSNLQSFLQSIPDTVTVVHQGSQCFVKPVIGKQYRYMADMVHGQKTAKKTIKPTSRRPYSSSWNCPPAGPRPFGAYRHPNRGRGMRNNGPRQSRPNFQLHTNNSNSDWNRPTYRPPVRRVVTYPPTFPPNMRPNMPRGHPIGRVDSPTSPTSFRPNASTNKQNWTSNSSTSFSSSPPSPTLDQTSFSPKSAPSPVHDSPKDKLKAETERLQFTLSEYKSIMAGKKKPYWISKVILKGTSYSSYPIEHATRIGAENAAATAALDGLAKLSLLPDKPATSDVNLARRRVAEMVLETNAGMWYAALCELYKSKFNERLPDNFLEICLKQKKEDIIFYSPDDIHWIVQRYIPDEIPKTTDYDLESKDEEYDDTWPALKWPEEKQWYVYVTYIKNYCSVSVKLIGPEYSEAYEALITKMEMQFMDTQNMVPEKNIVIDEFYACCLEGSWFRVVVEKIEGDSAIVNFVDHGDDELVPLKTLYKLEKEYRKLAMQSIPCTLAGVDAGYEHEGMLAELQKLALGKSLVAGVLSVDPVVSIVLFDTSTDEDININDRMLKILPETFIAPQLPAEGGICESYVMHVENNGDIYVTLESSSQKLLKTVLDDSQENFNKEDPIPGLIDVNQMYLGKSSKDDKWKRALPRSANLDTNQVLMQFADTGASEYLLPSAIVSLDAFSPLLSKIAHQAIRCRLNNVPSSKDLEWTEATVSRLNKLLPVDEPLLLKVQKEETTKNSAEVELFKRIQPQNELVSINATLAHDSNLFKKKEPGKDANSKKYFQREEDAMPLPKVQLPPILEYFDVYVSYAASPHNFGVQSISQRDKLAYLMKEIQDYYNVHNILLDKAVVPGHLYIAQHVDSNWYRVKADHCAGPMVSLLKVDYGDIFCTTNDKIMQLLPRFRKLPPQCYRASMTGITPINKDWTPEDCLRFRDLAEKKELVSVVLSVTAEVESLPYLELKLINTQNKLVDVKLDDLFIKEKRAFKTERVPK